jgi:hypothetical protein
MQSRHLTVKTSNYLNHLSTNNSNYSRKTSQVRLSDPITLLDIQKVSCELLAATVGLKKPAPVPLLASQIPY